MIDPELIKTFISLSETKNFNRTAEMLFVSQPTVTARMKKLEKEIGQTLFVRDNKHVSLTPIGNKFLPYAIRLYQAANECQTFVKDYEHFGKRLTISAPASCWDCGPTRQSIIDYCRMHPDNNIRFLRNTSDQTLPLISTNEVDLGIVYHFSSDPNIVCVPYYEEDLLLLASSSMELPPERNFMEIDGIAMPPMVSPTYAATASKLVEEQLYMLPCGISSDHPMLYLELVKQGFGIGLLQRSFAEDALRSGELVMVKCDYNDHPTRYKNYLAFQQKNEAALQDVIHLLLEDAKRYFGE